VGPSPPKVAPPIPAPKLDDPAVLEAQRRELALAARARSRAATVLTGGMGDTSIAPAAIKTLLGG
jgi:hypothetical protein